MYAADVRATARRLLEVADQLDAMGGDGWELVIEQNRRVGVSPLRDTTPSPPCAPGTQH